MKRYFLPLFLLAASVVAAPVNFVFNNAPIIEVVAFYYKIIKKENYVLLPDALGDSRPVSINAMGVEPENIEPLFNALLASSGLSAAKSGDVWMIGTAKSMPAAAQPASALGPQSLGFPPAPGPLASPLPPDSEPLVYAPKHRPVEALLPLIAPFAPGLPDKLATSDLLVVPLPKSRHKDFRAFLAKVDVPQPQIYLTAYLYEVQLSSSDANAIGLVASLFKGKFGFTLDAKPLTNQLTFKAADFSAVLSALATDSRFNSLSSPSVRVDSGSTARFSAGADVPVLDAIQENTNGTTRQSVVYRPSGVILDVTPLVYGDVVNLAINQQVSSFTATQTGVLTSPTLNKREVKTRLSTAFDDVVVIGGLRDVQDNADSAGVGFLPNWLRSRSASKTTRDVLLILRAERVESKPMVAAS